MCSTGALAHDHGADDLRIRELLERLSQGGVAEVIMATNPDTEGDATAMYISGSCAPLRSSSLAWLRRARGSNLEYADDATMLKALEGRERR
jgi:recombination protein RecR